MEGEHALGPVMGMIDQFLLASESDEMEMHASKPRPSKSRKVGHPEELNHYPSVDVFEWYNQGASNGQEE